VYQTAHDTLHQLWGHQEDSSEEQWREVFRLKFANQDNPQRFREGFSDMLAAQYYQDGDQAFEAGLRSLKADQAFEAELRSLKAELSDENFYDSLEAYLGQEDWRKADEETAWLFYVVMVLQGYEDLNELFKKFPSGTLNEIDRLWVTYSGGYFGFTVQKRIWKFGGASPNMSSEIWKEFAKQIGWYGSDNWVSYRDLSFSKQDSKEGNLPALAYKKVCWDEPTSVGWLGTQIGRSLAEHLGEHLSISFPGMFVGERDHLFYFLTSKLSQ
jgi:hypothetical protein